jgi:acetyl-CoA carboxylase carboxyltransferase component
MGASGAVEILNRSEIAKADDPVAKRAELADEYAERWLNPYVAADRGFIDDVIDPADTRKVLIEGLTMLSSKKEELPPRKHGNMPL